MDQRKAFLFFIFMVLVINVFWHTAIRIAAVHYAARKGDSPAASGLLVAV